MPGTTASADPQPVLDGNAGTAGGLSHTDVAPPQDSAPPAAESASAMDGLFEVGRLQLQQRDLAGARDSFALALEAGEREYGAEDARLIPCITQLAAVHMAGRKFAEAALLLQRVLTLTERHFGPEHEALSGHLSTLAHAYLRAGLLTEAEGPLLRLFGLKVARPTPPLEMATVLESLATLRHAQGQYITADQLWRQVLDIREKALPAGDPAIATVLEHLAETSKARGGADEARQLLERALSMRAHVLGDDHPALARLRGKIAALGDAAPQPPQTASNPEKEAARPAPAVEHVVEREVPVADLAEPVADLAEPEPVPAAPEPEAQIPVAIPATGRALVRVHGVEQEAVLAPVQDVEPAVPEAAPEAPFIRRARAATEQLGVRLHQAVVRRAAEAVNEAHEVPSSTFAERLRPVALVARERWPLVAAAALVLLAILVMSPIGLARHRAPALTWQVVGAQPQPSGGAPAVRASTAGDVATGAQSTAPAGTSARRSEGAAAAPERSGDGRTSEAGTPTDGAQRADRAGSDGSSTARGDEGDQGDRSAALPGAKPIVPNIDLNLPAADRERALPAVTWERRAVDRPWADSLPASEAARPASAYIAPGSPSPPYPPELKSQGLKGEVTAEFVVNESGRADVSSFNVLRSNHELFTRSVRSTLARMRFVPAVVDGQPVAQSVVLTFKFSQ